MNHQSCLPVCPSVPQRVGCLNASLSDATALGRCKLMCKRASRAGWPGAPKGPGAGQLLAETCVVSAAFLEDLQQKCLELARAAAEEALAARRESQAAASTSGQADGAPSHFYLTIPTNSLFVA